MNQKKFLLARSETRSTSDDGRSLLPEQRQFAAVIGDLLAEQWLAEQAARRADPDSIIVGRPVAPGERP